MSARRPCRESIKCADNPEPEADMNQLSGVSPIAKKQTFGRRGNAPSPSFIATSAACRAEANGSTTSQACISHDLISFIERRKRKRVKRCVASAYLRRTPKVCKSDRARRFVRARMSCNQAIISSILNDDVDEINYVACPITWEIL